MSDAEKFAVGVIFGFLLGCIVMVGFAVSTGSTYPGGQIDCLNGRIFYELVEQEDGTTKWETKKGGN